MLRVGDVGGRAVRDWEELWREAFAEADKWGSTGAACDFADWYVARCRDDGEEQPLREAYADWCEQKKGFDR